MPRFVPFAVTLDVGLLADVIELWSMPSLWLVVGIVVIGKGRLVDDAGEACILVPPEVDDADLPAARLVTGEDDLLEEPSGIEDMDLLAARFDVDRDKLRE